MSSYHQAIPVYREREEKNLMMGVDNVNLKNLVIPEKSLLHRIGRTKNQQISKRLRKKIKKAVEEINALAKPEAVVNILPARKNNGSVVLDGKTSLDSKKLAYALRYSRIVAVFLATIGSRVDRIIQKHMKSRPDYGFLLDAAASVAAESAAQNVCNHLKKGLHDDEKLTLRYSPGYCDWPLREQKKIFAFLPNDTIGVNLSKNLFMSPRKSVSGIVGICPSNLPEFSENPCLVCTKYDCPYRRTFSRQ